MTKKWEMVAFLLIFLPLFMRSSMGLSFSANPSKITGSYTKSRFDLPEIKVTNNDTETIEVFVKTAPLGQDSLGNAIEGDKNYRYSIANYIIINPNERTFTLSPGETFVLHPRVELAPFFNEPNGFALIEVECATLSAKLKAGSSGVLTTGTIGILVLLNFPNFPKKYDFRLKNISIEKRSDKEFRINTFFENTGNYLTEYKGTVNIKNVNGDIVSSLLLKPKSILPEHTVMLYATWFPESLPQDGVIIECEANSNNHITKKLAKLFRVESQNELIEIDR